MSLGSGTELFHSVATVLEEFIAPPPQTASLVEDSVGLWSARKVTVCGLLRTDGGGGGPSGSCHRPPVVAQLEALRYPDFEALRYPVKMKLQKLFLWFFRCKPAVAGSTLSSETSNGNPVKN